MSEKKAAILEAVKSLAGNYNTEEMLLPKGKCSLPSRSVIIELVRELRAVLFPGYFRIDTGACAFPEYYAGSLLNNLYDALKEQIEIAILYQGEEKEKAQLRAEEITGQFVKRLPEIQKMLLKDVQAGFDGDLPQKVRKRLFFPIRVFMLSMYIELHMSCILRRFRSFRESCRNLHMEKQELTLIRGPQSENIFSLITERAL